MNANSKDFPDEQERYQPVWKLDVLTHQGDVLREVSGTDSDVLHLKVFHLALGSNQPNTASLPELFQPLEWALMKWNERNEPASCDDYTSIRKTSCDDNARSMLPQGQSGWGAPLASAPAARSHLPKQPASPPPGYAGGPKQPAGPPPQGIMEAIPRAQSLLAPMDHWRRR